MNQATAIADAFTRTNLSEVKITRKNKAETKYHESKGTGKDDFIIEKNVPIPPRQIKTHAFPFSEMAHGDSFFVPQKKDETENACRKRFYGAFCQWKRLTNQPQNINQTTRITTKNGQPGIRFWMLTE